MKLSLLTILLLSLFNVVGQGIYAPGAGATGTSAIHNASSDFVSWGSHCEIIRGYQQIDKVQFGFANNGDSSHALNSADGVTVSLGDSGIAIYSLSQSIFNGLGADFAVFENGFSPNFLELAFVEVSSDGIHYFKFPSFSTTQDTLQIGTFGSIDPTHIHNMAGKYHVNYGTPFDLDEIPDNSLLDKENITHIKIIDVIGNILPEFASFDSQGNKVNDPWPTPFATSGFDLDALGLIHVNGINSLDEQENVTISMYPNPTSNFLTIDIDMPIQSVQLINMVGKTVIFEENNKLDLTHLPIGVYYVTIRTKNQAYVRKVVKK